MTTSAKTMAPPATTDARRPVLAVTRIRATHRAVKAPARKPPPMRTSQLQEKSWLAFSTTPAANGSAASTAPPPRTTAGQRRSR